MKGNLNKYIKDALAQIGQLFSGDEGITIPQDTRVVAKDQARYELCNSSCEYYISKKGIDDCIFAISCPKLDIKALQNYADNNPFGKELVDAALYNGSVDRMPDLISDPIPDTGLPMDHHVEYIEDIIEDALELDDKYFRAALRGYLYELLPNMQNAEEHSEEAYDNILELIQNEAISFGNGWVRAIRLSIAGLYLKTKEGQGTAKTN